VIERDYIMRMIQMLSQALAAILFWKRQKEYPKAAGEIRKVSKQLLGIELEVLGKLSDAQMIGLLSLDPMLGIGRCYAAGMLLKEEGEIAVLADRVDEGHAALLKSLSLLAESGLRNRGPFEAAHSAAVDDVIRELEGAEVPVHTLKKLFSYYDLTGQFAKAAPILDRAVELEPGFAAEGSKFYSRLAARIGNDPQEGGLAKEQIEAGLSKYPSKS